MITEIKVIPQEYEIIAMPSRKEYLDLLERAGRTCYLSEPKGDPGAFISGLVKRGHHSVIEHCGITLKVVTNRGITHEIVRHRLCSFSQESTRYCDYQGQPMEFIHPWWAKMPLYGNWTIPILTSTFYGELYETPEVSWIYAMIEAATNYRILREKGLKPEDARGVLPNDLRATIVWTANMREWRHILNLRGSLAAHPQFRELSRMILREFNRHYPEIFQDIAMKYEVVSVAV
jgi:thymidylate synthase (FAD)